MIQLTRRLSLCALLAMFCSASAHAAEPLALIVMDPLALPLACPCVEGYAQRDYERLGRHIAARTGRPVKVHFSESLEAALKTKSAGKADIVIGKDSVVRFEAARTRLQLDHFAALTDKEGGTTQFGLVVVAFTAPVATLADLKGYRVIFGGVEAQEKHGAALALFKDMEVEVPAKPETCGSCSEGALLVIDQHRAGQKIATVISSYAQPLLEGCGTIKKGDLRVIGKTGAVPFINAFINRDVPAEQRKLIEAGLLEVGKDADLRKAMETRDGFVASARPQAWNGFRGPGRDGRVAWLPEKLIAPAKIAWQRDLTSPGVGGVAADERFVIVSDRELRDQVDSFKCLAADDGRRLWSIEYPALGSLDYGNSPRATPLIDGGNVYLLGAFGNLLCVELATGAVHWQKNLKLEYDVDDDRKWGMCGSPLIVDDKLIVQPGGNEASLVALDKTTGRQLWAAPGRTAGYGSFIVATLGGRRQLVGQDSQSLGGWDIETGKRLWELRPDKPGEFHVPTPIVIDGKLLVCGEANGARLHTFDTAGRIIPAPLAANRYLAPDTHTPVVVGNRVFGAWRAMYCLDVADSLKTVWKSREEPFRDYCSLIASDDRVLACTLESDLVLLDARADQHRELGRVRLFDRERGCYSYPALVGKRLYVRGSAAIAAIDL